MGLMIVLLIQTGLTEQFFDMFEKFIQAVPTFSEEECKRIIAEAQDKVWKQSTVFADKERGCQISNIRTSTSAHLDSTWDTYHMAMDRIHAAYRLYSDYVLAAIPKEELRFPMPMSVGSKSTIENLGILRYEPGQHYVWHIDANADVNTTSHDRVISVVTYLNNDFEGGKTEFIDGARRGKPGVSLFFPSNWIFRHRAQPVTKGVKYAIVTWYRIYQD